jgi:AcrR family transcriptional regulator
MMVVGRKGWGGSPPNDDDDARMRILEAAVRCVDRSGAAATTIGDIASELEVTRPTIYRYYDGIDAVFLAVAKVAFDSWAARMERHTAHLDDPIELVVESTAYVIEHLPDEPLLTLTLSSGRSDEFSALMYTPEAIATGRALLLHSRIDWTGLGYDARQLDELVEVLMRIIQSMLVTPGGPTRRGKQLRTYLLRWLGPLVIPPV